MNEISVIGFAKLPASLVGMESCGGAHCWSKELSKLGHTVRMMASAFVKPHLKRSQRC
jgi:transposase